MLEAIVPPPSEHGSEQRDRFGSLNEPTRIGRFSDDRMDYLDHPPSLKDKSFRSSGRRHNKRGAGKTEIAFRRDSAWKRYDRNVRNNGRVENKNKRQMKKN